MLTVEDRSHLKTLGICWYVYAGLSAIGGLCGVLYMIIGIVALTAGGAEGDEEALAMGGIFTVTGIVVIIIVIPTIILAFLTAGGLMKGRRRALIYVMAVLACLNIPLGLVLGIFTFIVMNRPTVRAAFDAGGITPA